MSGMKAKTIKAIIRKKVDEWIASVEDEALRALLKKNVIITGGCLASMLLGEKVNDFDVYLRDYETALAVAKYYLARFHPTDAKGIRVPIKIRVDDNKRIRIVAQSAGVASEAGTDIPYEYFESSPDQMAGAYVGEVITDPAEIEDAYQETEQLAQQTEDDGKPKYRPVFISTNAITLSHRIQIILRFYGEPEQIHENYDFVHCTNHWQSWDSELVLRPTALEALLARELRYVGSKYPVCSMVRVRKFVGRGWKINAGQLLKMAMQISQLDLTDIKVLEDQLTGVDTAYFLQPIERLKENDPEKVNSAYLIEIIDRLF